MLNTSYTGPATAKNDAIKAFYEKSHPGVVIEPTIYPYPNYLTALKTAFAGGSEPDTVLLNPGPLVNEYAPDLVPLDSYAARRWGPQWRKQLVPIAVTQILAADPLGKSMYGLPVALQSGTALYYNTAIFAKYGLKAPQSYADLKNIADILNSHNIIPIVWGAKDGWPNFDWYRMLVEQTAPGAWLQALQGKAKFTHPGLVQALAILVTMHKDRIFQRSPFGTTNYPQAVAYFTSGKAAMYAGGSWDLVSSFYDPPNSVVRNSLSLCPIPRMAPGLKNNILFGTVGGITAVTKGSSDRQAAFDFIAWQNDAGQELAWVQKANFLSTRPALAPPRMPNAQYQKMLQYFASALPTAVLRYDTQLTAPVQTATEEAIANALTLGMAPLTAMRGVQAAYDSGAKKT